MTPGPVVSDVQPITPHNEALYEAGKKILVDSLDTSRDFCKFMITTSLSALPIYLGLLQLAVPKDHRPSVSTGAVFLAPAVVFLASALVSVIGYLPRMSEFSLDLPEEIERERRAVILRRRRYARIAVVMFSLAALSAAATTLWGFALASAK